MFKHAYILYIDSNPHSVQYANECAASCQQYGLIPHLIHGHTSLSYTDVCERYGFEPHAWRQDLSLEDFPGSFDRIASVDAGHFDIWKMIVESGEPGIVLEHKAIVKGPIDVGIEDGDIVHFGPRILNLHDYDYPLHADQDLVPVEQWEGVHAYGITPATAQQMLDYLSKYGYIDSTDPMLAFRNTFDLNMYTVDPPPIVVVNGNRQSTYTPNKVSAFWNAYHTPGFLANMKRGASIAPLRHIVAQDRSFDDHLDDVDLAVRHIDGYPVDVLVLNTKEGYESLKLGNRLLHHEDSVMTVIAPTETAQAIAFNAYFCWNYTKVTVVPLVDSYTELLYNATLDPEIAYDVIYYKPKDTLESIIVDVLLCWKLLKSGGILFIDDVDNTDIAQIVEFVITSFIERDVKVTYGTSGITSLMRL